VRGVGLYIARVRITLGTSGGDLYSENKEICFVTSVFKTALGFDGIGEVKSIYLVTDAGFVSNTSLSTFDMNCSGSTITFLNN
jgi:hypothetical protein